MHTALLQYSAKLIYCQLAFFGKVKLTTYSGDKKFVYFCLTDF